MIQIDYLKIATSLRKQGYHGNMQNYIRRAAKNVAAGRPFRIINKPGDIIELPPENFDPETTPPEKWPKFDKYLITSKGKLSKI